MIRSVDIRCLICNREQENVLCAEDEQRSCYICGGITEQIWWKRPRGPAQWDDRTAVMVHINPATGDVRYPGQHTARLKEGYERVYLRSLPEVNKFEREHGTVNHVMHYDSNGRAIDDYIGNEKAVH